MSRRIFLSYLCRVKERSVGDEVCDEAQDVDGGEIDGCSCSGFSLEIQNGLRVEGEGPAEGVDPTEEHG